MDILEFDRVYNRLVLELKKERSLFLWACLFQNSVDKHLEYKRGIVQAAYMVLSDNIFDNVELHKTLTAAYFEINE